jgi:hypothetical protein
VYDLRTWLNQGEFSVTKDQIRAAVTAAIVEVEGRCGREAPQVLQGEIRPVVDLVCWDSLLGVEATLVIEEKVGRELAAESIFVTDVDNPKARSIDEIVNLLFDSLANEHAA